LKLIPCPACKKEIAVNARACPHCGYDLRGEETRSFLLYLGALALIVYIVYLLLYWIR
jgi:hypothetical protein